MVRRLIAFLVLLTLGGCAGDVTRQTTPTTNQAVQTTTEESRAPSSTAPPATSTTVATTSDEDPGTESIGVTETITITITDPED